MPSQLEQDRDLQPGLTTLVSGIIEDGQRLIRQQLELFQVEVSGDMRRTLAATMPLCVGFLVCMLAGAMLSLTLAYGLLAIWPTLPLWGAFGIVTGALVVLGACLVAWGVAKFKAFNPLPDQTVEGLKENLQWETKR